MQSENVGAGDPELRASGSWQYKPSLFLWQTLWSVGVLNHINAFIQASYVIQPPTWSFLYTPLLRTKK